MSELKVEIENGNNYTVESISENSAKLNGTEMKWDSLSIKEGKFNVIKDNKSYMVELISADATSKTFELKVNNAIYQTKVEDKFDLLLKQLGMDKIGSASVADLKAPMPGMVLKIEVEAGQEVKKGDPLIVLEAMKMENVLKSPEDLIVKNIPVKQAVAVEKNEVLIEFES